MYDANKDLSSQAKEIAYDYGIPKQEISEYITANLRHDFWDWQKKALETFLLWEKIKERKKDFGLTHWLFNMATGSGKTLLMAALILHYYKNGYRHFIFFVNQKNIVGKTEDNFINKNHPKYLFRQNIVIDDKIINLRKVENFDDSGDIQIKFTSIHKLHNAVYIAKENSTTLADLRKRDLVLIADEAHHLNAATMKNGQKDLDFLAELKENASAAEVERSWEDTVINKILNRGNDKRCANKNVLLEFTATVPKNEEVLKKYENKIIYKFGLADFLNAGYTKEINLISTTFAKKEKILLALLFNWYRHQIALKHGLANFKPVILFRSKFIEDSKNDYLEFLEMIARLTPVDFDFLKNIEKHIKQDQNDANKTYEQGKSRILRMAAFIKSEKIKIREIINYIQDEFAKRNCVITNSKDNIAATKEKTTEEQERLLNSLEDKDNHIRAIFTVKRLTEGWDVLNLFDIVRLYEGKRDETFTGGARKAGEATTQEIQLIGRGVRYCPFFYQGIEKNRRKFDNDLENPLRVLEEFYFHSGGRDSEGERRYVDELKRELKNRGYIRDDRVLKTFALKNEFKKTEFFKEIKIWKNERVDNPRKHKQTLADLKKDFVLEYKIKDFALKEQKLLLNEKDDETLAQTASGDKKTIDKKLKDFEKHIIAKAINIKAAKDLSLLRFCNLRGELDIAAVDDLASSRFAGDFKINIIAPAGINDLDDVSSKEKLEIMLEFFDKLAAGLKEIANPYLGTPEFKPFSFAELFGAPKQKNVIINAESQSLEAELSRNEWYVLDGFNGTGEERGLLEFLKNKIGNLRQKYDEVYLLRNEEIFKIYDFKQGRGFEPDFLLFLKGKTGNLYYQIFIEPKGGQFADASGDFSGGKEAWKEDFLKKISEKYGNGDLLKAENKKYRLIGLPLFNQENSENFDKIFAETLLR